MERFDICIAGAGLSGSVLAERHADVFGHTVLVMDKREHIGGNVYDYIDRETGIRVSKYGVHLFHTKFHKVWNYVKRFSEWTKWEHKAVAKVQGTFVPVPVNIDTVNLLFGANITNVNEMRAWLDSEQVTFDHPKNSEEKSLDAVGKRLYEIIFRPYTIKQWDKDPKLLGPSITGRIPVRDDYEDRYFTDRYQFYPTYGYTRWVENMLKSPLITVRLKTDYFQVRGQIKCGRTYFTGPIDAYFAQTGLPKLEYRSLEFERVVYKNTNFFQPMAHVNYPGLEYNFTRAIEYKHLLHQKSPHTVVFFERSTDVGEPYYPVPTQRNQNLFQRYKGFAANSTEVTFVGRLANYKYFNMDETVLNALKLFLEVSIHSQLPMHLFGQMFDLIAITPFSRRHKMACYHKTRLERLVERKKRVLWIVVEDAVERSPELVKILSASSFDVVHVNTIKNTGNLHKMPLHTKGHIQRQTAFNIIKTLDLKGVIWNLDDDLMWADSDIDQYIELVTEGTVLTLPVGNLPTPGGAEYAVFEYGSDPHPKVVRWCAGKLRGKSRKYPVDMASMLFRSEDLLRLDINWEHSSAGGESEFMEKILGGGLLHSTPSHFVSRSDINMFEAPTIYNGLQEIRDFGCGENRNRHVKSFLEKYTRVVLQSSQQRCPISKTIPSLQKWL